MPNTISVGLVRRVTGYSAEQLGELEVLNLNGQGIEEIDNLEVFAQILELHLKNNSIRVVENLEYLYQLEFLDLSENRIDSSGLRSCLGKLPRSLQTLNLSGNACAEDEALLMELQESMPALGIIVGLEEGGEEEEKGGQAGYGDDEEEEEEDEEEEAAEDDGERAFSSLSLGANPLDADEILKAIVERKCRVQYATPDASTSIQNTMEATEEEKRPPGSFGTPGRDPAVAEQVQQRVAEMIRQHEQEAGDAKRFMETLKADALRKRNATYAALTKEEA